MALPPVAIVNWAALTVMAGLVLAAWEPSLWSVAVSVKPPLVLKKTGRDELPAANDAGAGRVAVESLEVIPTVSLTVLTRFQLASTALTVTFKPLKADCALGVPVLPVLVPGAAISPGTS